MLYLRIFTCSYLHIKQDYKSVIFILIILTRNIMWNIMSCLEDFVDMSYKGSDLPQRFKVIVIRF